MKIKNTDTIALAHHLILNDNQCLPKDVEANACDVCHFFKLCIGQERFKRLEEAKRIMRNEKLKAIEEL